MKRNAIAILLLAGMYACQPATENNQQTPDEEHQHNKPAGKGYADSVNAGLIEKDTLKGSPFRSAHYMEDGLHMQIDYGSPGVKGRSIWGGLVAYDEVWATGAHNATKVTFDKDLMVGGKKVPAGSYAFFTIPAASEWRILLNSQWKQHLADDYDSTFNVAEITMRPLAIDPPVQRLTYQIVPVEPGAGQIEMVWEKVKVILPFRIAP